MPSTGFARHHRRKTRSTSENIATTNYVHGTWIGLRIAWRALAIFGVVTAVACSDAPTPLEPDGGETLPTVGAIDLGVYPSGTGTLELRFESGREEYLLAFQSISDATAGFDLAINTNDPLALMMPSPQSERIPAPHSPIKDAETRIRQRGDEAVATYGLAPRLSRLLQAEAPVQRSFWIEDPRLDDAVMQRPATLKYIGAHVLIYVDDAVPNALVNSDDAATLGMQFDTRVYEPVRALYGSPSDLDANGRVILFLSPIVNLRVFDCTTQSRTAGYFHTNDMSDSPFSNHGEILYLLVPDPQGEFACATDDVRTEIEGLVGLTAHELTHAVAFNERRFERNLPSQDDWLEEALAHNAEIVLEMPVLAKGQIYHYLRNGSNQTSLTGKTEAGSFVRGAATLFVKRLVDRFGTDVLRELITGRGAGVETVEGATGEEFASLFHDWSLALYNDIYPIPNVAPQFSSLDLLEWVETRFGPMGREDRDAAEYNDPYGGGVYYALGPYVGTVPGVAGFIPMENASVAYLGVTTDRSSTMAELHFSAPASAELQVAVIRIQ